MELKKSQTKDSDDLLNGTNILSTSGRHTITQTTLNLWLNVVNVVNVPYRDSTAVSFIVVGFCDITNS